MCLPTWGVICRPKPDIFLFLTNFLLKWFSSYQKTKFYSFLPWLKDSCVWLTNSTITSRQTGCPRTCTSQVHLGCTTDMIPVPANKHLIDEPLPNPDCQSSVSRATLMQIQQREAWGFNLYQIHYIVGGMSGLTHSPRWLRRLQLKAQRAEQDLLVAEDWTTVAESWTAVTVHSTLLSSLRIYTRGAVCSVVLDLDQIFSYSKTRELCI